MWQGNFRGGGVKFCPECGAKLEDVKLVKCGRCGKEFEGKFCPECGAKKPDAPKKHFCVNCGYELKENQKFCPECGTKAE